MDDGCRRFQGKERERKAKAKVGISAVIFFADSLLIPSMTYLVATSRRRIGVALVSGSSNPGYISWRVDWHFAACGQVLTEPWWHHDDT